jgi:hypothetical protein
LAGKEEREEGEIQKSKKRSRKKASAGTLLLKKWDRKQAKKSHSQKEKKSFKRAKKKR